MEDQKKYFIHPSAIVDTRDIGKYTRIWAFVHILDKVSIGTDCNICDFCFIENGVAIGNNVTVKSGVCLWEGVTLQDNVFVGPNVVFTNDLKPRSKVYPERYLNTLVMEGASLGANSTILAGVKIGRYAMTGAGSVVTKDVGDYTLVTGSPARFKCHICKCTREIIFGDRFSGCSCGRKYQLDKDRVIEI